MRRRPVWLGDDARGWDHVRIHSTVLLHPHLSAADLRVYAVIAYSAEVETGRARLGPGQKDIAAMANLGERTVRDSIAELERQHLLEVEHRIGAASTYRLLPPPRQISPDPPRRILPESAEPTPADLAGGEAGIAGGEANPAGDHKEVGFSSDSSQDSSPEEPTSSPSAQRRRRVSRQTFDDWTPPPEERARAQQVHPTVDVDRELEKFKNHHGARRWKGITVPHLAFRNWLLNAEEWATKKSGGRAQPEAYSNDVWGPRDEAPTLFGTGTEGGR